MTSLKRNQIREGKEADRQACQVVGNSQVRVGSIGDRDLSFNDQGSGILNRCIYRAMNNLTANHYMRHDLIRPFKKDGPDYLCNFFNCTNTKTTDEL